MREIDLPSRSYTALALSLVFHVLVFTLLGIALADWIRPAGTGDRPDRKVGIAIAYRLPDRTRYEALAEQNPESSPVKSVNDRSESAGKPAAATLDRKTVAAATSVPAGIPRPIDLVGELAAMTGDATTDSNAGIAGDRTVGPTKLGTLGSARQASAGEATTTSVFGVSGSGSKFVYVFDRSESMNGFGGRPLAVAKSELIKSLETLSEKQRFQIIFYNNHPKPYRVPGLPVDLIVGDQVHRSRAAAYVRSINAFGGTEHEAALRMAIRMAPDVIFFLTDARVPELSPGQLANIRDLADATQTSIHAIEFGAESNAPAGSFLRDLANQNRGRYRYLNIAQLSPNAP